VKKTITWDDQKNQLLMRERNISFETVVTLIENSCVLSIVKGKGKFLHQKQFIVELNGYVYIVPFVEDKEKIFLKTIIPSRKLTKEYLSGKFKT
jgi:uncharacterized DUF497 family protein